MNSAERFIKEKLDERRSAGNYRALKLQNNLVDFCSNDYLGFARSAVLKAAIDREIKQNGIISNGSTGSRLLTGNSAFAEELEGYLASLYGCEAALVFNSGYDANLGLLSALPRRGDTIITDELIHASIIDGARLSYANRYIFKHNDLASLEEKLKHAKGNCYVVVESVYSMDGDSPPLKEILTLTEKYGAYLIADEAHAIGLYGLGMIGGEIQHRVFARVVTFGKALGCHGAVVLGSRLLKDYLVNFARSFIYTTAAPYHQLASVRMAFELLVGSSAEIERLNDNISTFKQNLDEPAASLLTCSNSAIQCVLLKSNEKTTKMAAGLQNAGLDVRAILSPTVPAGTERIRICLHAFNTPVEIYLLTNFINHFINGQ